MIASYLLRHDERIGGNDNPNLPPYWDSLHPLECSLCKKRLVNNMIWRCCESYYSCDTAYSQAPYKINGGFGFETTASEIEEIEDRRDYATESAQHCQFLACGKCLEI